MMRARLAIAVALVCLASIGTWAANPGRAVTARFSTFQSGDDLPDGEGKKILEASCTACHDLTEVTKFKGFYTKDEWRDIVKTMIAYGAVVKEQDREVLVEYLYKSLGKK